VLSPLAVSPCPSLFPWASFPVVFVAALFLSLAVAQCAPLAPAAALAVQLDVLQDDPQDALWVPYELLAVHSAASPCDPLAGP
jgi:hypothetical protein